MDQSTRETPPLLMKIGLGVIGITSLYAAAKHAMQFTELAGTSPFVWLVWLNGFALNGIAVICVEAAWRLRRWGAIGVILTVSLSTIEGVVVTLLSLDSPLSRDFHLGLVLAALFVVKVLPLVMLAPDWRRLK